MPYMFDTNILDKLTIKSRNRTTFSLKNKDSTFALKNGIALKEEKEKKEVNTYMPNLLMLGMCTGPHIFLNFFTYTLFLEF